MRWPLDGRCYRLYGRGICQEGHWFVWSSADNRLPVCCPSQYTVRTQCSQCCLTRLSHSVRGDKPIIYVPLFYIVGNMNESCALSCHA